MQHGSAWFAVGLVVVASSMIAAAAGSGCASDHEVREIPALEGGPPKETGASDATPSQMCPSDLPVDGTKLAYKPPTAPQTDKCDAADLDAMKEFLLMNPKASNEDFENFVKNRDRTCHDCVFADSAAATWPPAPLKDGKVLTFNVGACYAIVTGSAACGQAVQNAWDCEFEACTTCESPSQLEACRAKSRSGVCKAFQDASHVSCVNFAADEQCGSPFDSIRVQCITTVKPPVDGGADAAMDAGANADAAADADAN